MITQLYEFAEIIDNIALQVNIMACKLYLNKETKKIMLLDLCPPWNNF